MTTIPSSLVKELREKTGAGMMDCKNALVESKGNIEQAIAWLRTKGLSSAAKKSDRIASKGLVGVIVKDKVGSIAEINSETDFVARNEKFQSLVNDIVELALTNNFDQLLSATYPKTGKKVEENLKEAIAIIGENMNLRRAKHLSVNDGVIGSYVHNEVASGLGQIGVLIAIESKGEKAKLEALAKNLAMHIAALKPAALNVDDVSKDSLENEKQIFSQQARNSGKPDNIIEKMVEGRIRKYYEEIVLLEQNFVKDDKIKIKDLITQTEKELGTSVKINDFVIYQLGEGIEQVEKNFADEVNAVINK